MLNRHCGWPCRIAAISSNIVGQQCSVLYELINIQRLGHGQPHRAAAHDRCKTPHVGEAGPHSALGWAMLWGLNSTAVFSHRDDTLETLEAGLEEHLDALHIELTGAVAVFRGVLKTADRGN